MNVRPHKGLVTEGHIMEMLVVIWIDLMTLRIFPYPGWPAQLMSDQLGRWGQRSPCHCPDLPVVDPSDHVLCQKSVLL